MKQLVKVHMLPTQDSTHIRDYGPGLLYMPQVLKMAHIIDGVRCKHLYITSDEAIKEGDWCLDLINKIAFQFKFFDSDVLHSDNHSQFNFNCRKVVATTDKEINRKKVYRISRKGETLHQDSKGTYEWINVLPQIPQQFIEDYCKAEGIDEVYLEVEGFCRKAHPFNYCQDCKGFGLESCEYGKYLSIDSNNYVTIHPIEPKLYTKEEVEKLCVKAYDTGAYFRLWLDKIAIGLGKGKTTEEIHSEYGLNNWLRENLK